MSDWMGQRITPTDDERTVYCVRHRMLVSADDGCERCQHERTEDDNYMNELCREVAAAREGDGT